MKTIFDKQAADETIARIEKVSASDKPQWGIMNAAQMMAHCAETFKVARDEKQLKRSFIGYVLGPVFKKGFYNEKPLPKNSPTAPSFKFPDSVEFEASKNELIAEVRKFHEGGTDKCTARPHGFFGKLTKEQWGMGMYKHTDHHLQQFGV